MKLKNVELIPGVVVNENDPLKQGRVKAVAVGMFDMETMSVEGMPWLYPFAQTGYQGYSKMKNGQKVWILNNTEVNDEFWYIPFFELNKDTMAAIDANEESDVILSRTIGDNVSMQVYYNKTDGLVLKIGDDSIVINQVGDIIAKSNGMTIKAEGSHVYVGSKETEFQPMVLGNELKTLLSNLSSDLQNLATAAQTSMYTMHMYDPIMKVKSNLDDTIPKIISPNCSLN